MHLRAGIPTLAEVEALLAGEVFAEHVASNAQFLERFGHLLRRYEKVWGRDPLSHWSRRWEYPFVAGRMIDFKPRRILDAGSGVTYLPHFLCEKLPDAQVTCCDSNRAY